MPLPTPLRPVRTYGTISRMTRNGNPRWLKWVVALCIVWAVALIVASFFVGYDKGKKAAVTDLAAGIAGVFGTGSSPAPPGEAATTAQDLARVGGCTITEPVAKALSSEAWRCGSYEIALFPSDDVRDQFISLGQAMRTSMGAKIAYGSSWVVFSNDGSDVSAFGGTVV